MYWIWTLMTKIIEFGCTPLIYCFLNLDTLTISYLIWTQLTIAFFEFWHNWQYCYLVWMQLTVVCRMLINDCLLNLDTCVYSQLNFDTYDYKQLNLNILSLFICRFLNLCNLNYTITAWWFWSFCTTAYSIWTNLTKLSTNLTIVG